MLIAIKRTFAGCEEKKNNNKKNHLPATGKQEGGHREDINAKLYQRG